MWGGREGGGGWGRGEGSCEEVAFCVGYLWALLEGLVLGLEWAEIEVWRGHARGWGMCTWSEAWMWAGDAAESVHEAIAGLDDMGV